MVTWSHLRVYLQSKPINYIEPTIYIENVMGLKLKAMRRQSQVVQLQTLYALKNKINESQCESWICIQEIQIINIMFLINKYI